MIAPIAIQQPPPPEVGKRVVLIDCDGLFHIIGWAKTQPDALLLWQFFPEEPPIEFSLIKSTPRSYIYREMSMPETSRFGEFNPEDGMRSI